MNTPWTAEQAFQRNLGLISETEQKALADALVVIPGCGGIGSTVAETLARLGIGRFRLSDADQFDVANFNRQLGATMETVGRVKAEAVAERIRLINPSADVEIFPEWINQTSAGAFVTGASVVLDGIDFFAITARRALFAAALNQGIPAMTAAPLGFSSTLQVYLPDSGMTFDEFFGFKPTDGPAEMLTRFLIGLAPKALQRPYMDMSQVDAANKSGPSSIIGTQLASALIGAEVVRLSLKRGGSLPAPWYRQFDAYRQQWVKRYLPLGNRHPVQQMKYLLTRRAFERNGLWKAFSALKSV